MRRNLRNFAEKGNWNANKDYWNCRANNDNALFLRKAGGARAAATDDSERRAGYSGSAHAISSCKAKNY